MAYENDVIERIESAFGSISDLVKEMRNSLRIRPCPRVSEQACYYDFWRYPWTPWSTPRRFKWFDKDLCSRTVKKSEAIAFLKYKMGCSEKEAQRMIDALGEMGFVKIWRCYDTETYRTEDGEPILLFPND